MSNYLSKGMRWYLVDQDKNILADLGVMPISIFKSTTRNYSATESITGAKADLESKVVAANLLGNMVISRYPSVTEIITALAPISVFFDPTVVLTPGNYLMGVNASGAYVLSENTGASYGWNGRLLCYDKQDTLVAYWNFPNGTPFDSSGEYGHNLVYTSDIPENASDFNTSYVGSLTYGRSTDTTAIIQFQRYTPSSEFIQWFYNLASEAPQPPVDPYAGAGDSEPANFPHGDFDYGSDPIGGADRYHIPTVSVVDTGFVTLYNPTIPELKALSNYLWSSAFDVDTFKKLFNNPMDLFIGLSMIPVRVPQGSSKEVGIGMIGSGVYMTTASEQFVIVNCGACDVGNFSGGYLDYSPYTKVEIYLPYIGFRTLNADEVMGKTINVMYKVDILSGACTCWVDVLTTVADGTTDLCTTYVFMGECAVSIPMASGDWTNLLNGIIGAAASVGAGFAAGGAGGAIAGGVSAASSVAVNDSKIHVERSGAITSSAGLMAPQSPFLIISTPHIHKPAEVPYYTGYPAYFTAVLGDLSGYTIIDKIHLNNIPATDPELEEIEALLKGGVLL